MELRERRLVPVVGGVTAAATAVAALGPATHVAEAAPDVEAGATSPLGLAQEGVFEACSAYFGFGKDAGVAGMVGFEVEDVNGADGVAHAVPDDVQVVLVIEGESGDTLECVPEEISAEDYASWIDDISFDNAPPWPPSGPVRFAYPSVVSGIEIEGLGNVTAVGYRVVGIPGEHTLVSPTGVQPLPDHYRNTWLGEFDVDPRLTEVIADAAGPDAVAAYEAAMAACAAGEDPDDPEDPDLVAALQALLDFVGHDTEFTEAQCWSLDETNVFARFAVGTIQSYERVETIRLQVPEETTPTTQGPATGGAAAQPVPATPTYTG